MNSNAEQHQTIPIAVLRSAICRLEEKCAVISAMECAWNSPAVSDDTKRLVMIDVRRALIDVIVGLEESTPPQ